MVVKIMRKIKFEIFSTAKETSAVILQTGANIQNLKRMAKIKHINKLLEINKLASERNKLV